MMKQTNHTHPRISLVATVRNEGDNITQLLESMLWQTRQPDEIVINDNGSTDVTVSIIRRYQQAHPFIQLVQGQGNIAQGRNRAIAHSRGEIVACCDAGIILPAHWLETITAPLLSGQADVVGGFTRSNPQSLWELALGVTTLPDATEIQPDLYLPATRSIAFTQEAWEFAGGFPEWATTGEDLIFDIQLKKHGFRFAFRPQAFVHFRPRRNVRDYFYQYYWYAYGDGVANLWIYRHMVRYTAYFCLVCWLWLTMAHSPFLVLFILLGVALHTARPYQRLTKQCRHLTWSALTWVILLIPFIRLVGDIAKMMGYPVGVYHRFQQGLTPSPLHDGA